MTDLIKRDDALAAIYEDSPEWTREAIAALPAIDPADRIEELVRQRDGWEETALMYAQNVDFWESKLTKAVEALRNTLDKPRDADQSYAGLCSEVMWEIRATLAELEEKK